ncbi:transmembrane protein 33-like [Artemia franciscana]|uniref:transmembrane protein 33-like n=1 Tax=Artemia franciscana TaxID=6661 RepID=UPI0032DBE3F8
MSNQGQPSEQEQAPPEASTSDQGKFAALFSYFKSHPYDVVLAVTRLLTLVYSFGYVFPFFMNPQDCYFKALASNAATSALRLNQRAPPFQLSQIYFAQLLLEDSAHYLFYSLTFIYSPPLTLVLLPVALFAILNFSHASSAWLAQLNENDLQIGRKLIGFIEAQRVNILRLIAYSEILLMPLLVILAFSTFGILKIFMYYRFLSLRYSSRRNPYTRNSFTEFRIVFEQLANNPRCPTFIRSLIHRSISFISRLAPMTVPT